jgi:hypothetical protein
LQGKGGSSVPAHEHSLLTNSVAAIGNKDALHITPDTVQSRY